ncbi:type IV conjugative transfer system coupling protein TraD [soil metagenome]
MQNNAIKNTTRGGQIFLHNFRMITQVLNKVLLWTLPMWLLISCCWLACTTTPEQRYTVQQWAEAKSFAFFDSEHHHQLFTFPTGRIVNVEAKQIINAPFVKKTLDLVYDKSKGSFWVGLLAYILTIAGVLTWLKMRGDKQTSETRIKGDYLGEVKEITKILKAQKKTSTLSVGIQQLPLPPFAEMQHFLFHGTTGSGKSTAIKEFLDRIRERGERAIVYDKSCNLVKEFFKVETDVLMNCLDERGVDWSLWKECRDKSDFESLAAALMPMPPSNQDPFWVNAARTIFAASAHRMSLDNKTPRIVPLLRYLLTADIQELQSLLKGTEAESLMSEKAEKTAISIKSVLATYLKSLCYVKDGDNNFSIREWVQNDKASQWLFISSQGDKHESLKPLITAWLDIAVNALLSLPENPTRRIWIILDELTSLQQLPYLTAALSEARKFGGCFIIGVQSYAQMAQVYGYDGGRVISSLLNTRFMFRMPDPDIAKWSAMNLGETLVEEVREGVSYGANTIRDGVSINRSERFKSVVNYSEIMLLNDLQSYVRLPGNYPITHLNFSYPTRAQLAPPFVARVLPTDSLRAEVVTMVDKISTVVPSPSPAVIESPVMDPNKPTRKTKKNKKEPSIEMDVDRVFSD